MTSLIRVACRLRMFERRSVEVAWRSAEGEVEWRALGLPKLLAAQSLAAKSYGLLKTVDSSWVTVKPHTLGRLEEHDEERAY